MRNAGWSPHQGGLNFPQPLGTAKATLKLEEVTAAGPGTRFLS